ncbi:MAG: glycoside hydrolase [Bacteroidota bacterium]
MGLVKYNVSKFIGYTVGLLWIGGLIACSKTDSTVSEIKEQAAFPWNIPQTKPDRPLSKGMARLYDNYRTPRPQDNELFSSFKHTPVEGFDYNNGDGTISRRDPSKIIKENGKYYVWYTKRHTQFPPVGMRRAKEATDVIPSADWDLSEIWYATSLDGFTWEEQGVAIPRPPKPNPGWRSVTTTDILKWEGKYYLYYQAFMEASGLKGDHCPVAASYADSPEGPWTPTNKIIIPNGTPGTWDQYSIHDPYPLVYKGKIYLYYKAAFGDRPNNFMLAGGLATADHPLGPFTKHPLNPLFNSGHETALFPFEEGMAALVIRDGNENNTIQYAPDGVHFDIAAVTQLMPTAAGAYISDAFNSNGNGRGITWGLQHFIGMGEKGKKYSMLSRFDCDLSLDHNDPKMKNTQIWLKPEVYFSQGLSEQQKQERMQY